jgi:hypothetical protein
MALTVKHMPEKFGDSRKLLKTRQLLLRRFFGERVYGNGFMVYMVMV